MKHIWKSVIVALLLVLIAQTSLYSQTIALPGDGKDFFVGFMLPSYNKVAGAQTRGYYGAYLLISSYSDNKATVSYFDKTTGVETPGTVYSIAERTGIQVPINLQYVVLNDTGDVPEFGAIHITAKRPINIEFFSSGACSGGSFLPITTAGLGNRYVVASYKDNNGEMGLIGNPYGPTALELAHGFFEIIAPFDGTTVTITPNSLTLGGHHGFSTGAGATRPNEQPYTINLRRGQCYLVKSGTDDEGDLSGSIIESTKPVAVIAGHENAAVGGTSGRYLEGRDFMAEQMYPYDMWDTTGFVMIPLKDSYPSDPATYEGTGENYRVFAWDKVGSRVQLYDGCLSGPIDMTAGRLGYPPAERFQVSCPVDFEATNGKKFSVMMYDNRNFATKDPYPGPSMISVIPMSRWRTSFLWYVPANKFESLQSYFVNILGPLADFDGPNGILASFNGGTIKPLKQVLSLEQQWKTIPNFPGIAGVRFRLYPGSYYATGPHPFMVYNFGFRGLDPNNDLGDLDGDDFFFSYGLPVGVKLGSGTPHMRVVVDTSCASWNVCVYDTTFGLSNQGIKSITLLDDPHGDFTKPGKQFYNTRLDDSLDPDHLGEINMSGDDTNVCFKVLVNKPIDSAYAPLFIVDDQGNAIIVELFYQPPLVRLSPDSGRYFGLSLSTDSCSTFVFKNNGNKKSGKSFYFSSADLLLKNPAFKVTGTIPALPVSIGPGDSLIINACFTAKDTATQHDTIELVNDCFTEPIDLIGNGVIPQIIASDHDFGTVIKDSTKCDTVGVRNVGKAPFMLTTSWVLHNIVNFDFSDSSRLPMLLKPGQVVYLTFCYTPHSVGTDTTVQNWGTTLENPYKHSIKDTSILRGKGVKTGFVWDRTVQQQTVTCEDTDIVRVHLLNNAIKGSSNIPAHVDSIYFTGPDASEFYILATQFGRTKNFDLRPGDSIWVDVVFKPTLAKPMPAKYADRHADLVASNHSSDPQEDDQIIAFTGTVKYAATTSTPSILNYGDVALGIVNSRSFLLCDTGTAPLIIKSFGPLTYPITGVSNLAPYDTIQPGGCKLVQIDMALTTYVDTSVVLNFVYQTNCPQPIPETLVIAASFINPTNTGHPFTPTFLNCRLSADSIQAQNKGTTDLTLKQIDIISTPATPNPTEFSFNAGSSVQTLVVNRLFRRNHVENFPVYYKPTIEGPVSATVKCTWDSAGVKTLYSTNVLTGIGRLERDTVTPIQATAIPYSNTTGNFIDVPITLTRTLPADVQAMGMSFSVTYRRDLLDVVKSKLNKEYDGTLSDYNAVPPTIVDDGAGNETVTFNLKSSVPITTLAPITTMHFEVMVSRDYSSTISVSNAVFWGNDPTDTLCYVINEVKTADFNPNPTCGDSTLRIRLNGGTPTRIIGITPNPSIEGQTPVATYEVKGSKVPVTIELFNALGDRIRVIEKDVLHESGQYELPVGLKNMPSGLYILRITTPTSVESGQFVIQK